jgi:hypothetical protein
VSERVCFFSFCRVGFDIIAVMSHLQFVSQHSSSTSCLLVLFAHIVQAHLIYRRLSALIEDRSAAVIGEGQQKRLNVGEDIRKRLQ